MMRTAILRGLVVAAACLAHLAAALNRGFRTSLNLRDFKAQVRLSIHSHWSI